MGAAIVPLTDTSGKASARASKILRRALSNCEDHMESVRASSIRDGVRGLGVCDTSVLPEITGSHTGTPTIVRVEECVDVRRHTRESVGQSV